MSYTYNIYTFINVERARSVLAYDVFLPFTGISTIALLKIPGATLAIRSDSLTT